MFKKSLLALSLFCFAVSAWANPISPQKAKEIAKEHFTRMDRASSFGSPSDWHLVHSFKQNDPLLAENPKELNGSDGSDQSTYFYAINRGEGKGFALVAADDRAPLILAYSLSGSFKTEKMPSNLQAWLKMYRSEMAELMAGRAKPFDAKEIQTRDLPNSVDALLESGDNSEDPIKWNQDYPWNYLIPKLPNGIDPPAGCVAISLAQVLRYHKWPNSAQGSYSYADTLYKDPPEYFEGNFGNSYDWANMPGTLPWSYGDEVRDALASFTKDVSFSVQMQFGPIGSASWMQYILRALRENFHYKQSASFHERQFYQQQEWHEMIRRELAQARPICYAGADTRTGHAFVCDGYNSDGYYHFNWGWGGYADGMFLLSLLNPGSGGIGSGSGGYTLWQEMIIGISPAKTEAEIGEKALPVIFLKEFRQVAHDFENDKLYINASIGNSSDITADIELGYSVISHLRGDTKADNSPVYEGTISWRSSYWDNHYAEFNIPMSAFQPDAHHKLIIVYRRKGDTEWKRKLYHVQTGNKPIIEFYRNQDGSISEFEYEHEDIELALDLNTLTAGLNLNIYNASTAKLKVISTSDLAEEVRGRMQIALKDDDGFYYPIGWQFVEFVANLGSSYQIDVNTRKLVAGPGNYKIAYRMMDSQINNNWFTFPDFSISFMEQSSYPKETIRAWHEQVEELVIDRKNPPSSLPSFKLSNLEDNFSGKVVMQLYNIGKAKGIILDTKEISLAHGENAEFLPSINQYYEDYASMPNGKYEIRIYTLNADDEDNLVGRKYYRLHIQSGTNNESVEQTLDNELKLYPTETETSVKAELPSNCTMLLLYNMQGQLLRKIACEGLSEIEIDLSALPAGSYIVMPQGSTLHTKAAKAQRVIRL